MSSQMLATSVLAEPDQFPNAISCDLTGAPGGPWKFEAMTFTSTPLIPVQASDDLRLKIGGGMDFSSLLYGRSPTSWVNVSQLLHCVAVAERGPEDRYPLAVLALQQLERMPFTRVDYRPTGRSARFWAISTLIALYLKSADWKVNVFGKEWTLSYWSYGFQSGRAYLGLINDGETRTANFDWEELKAYGDKTFPHLSYLSLSHHFSNAIFDECT